MGKSYHIRKNTRFGEVARHIINNEIRPGNTVSFFSEVDLTKLESIRSQAKANELRKPTYTAFVVKAVSKELVNSIHSKPRKILDLGCGSGQVYEDLFWKVDQYKAVDFAEQMCALHPKGNNVEVVCASFDDKKFLDSLKGESYDVVVSSSALQWSTSLPTIAKVLSQITTDFHATLFTSNTFKSIQEITGVSSPILSAESIKSGLTDFFDCEFKTLNHQIEFENKKELFEYIKKSGVSGGFKKLSFAEAKRLYKNYDKTYLEFEVLFVSAKSKIRSNTKSKPATEATASSERRTA